MHRALKQFRKPWSLSAPHFCVQRRIEHPLATGLTAVGSDPGGRWRTPYSQEEIFKHQSRLFSSGYFPTFPNIDAQAVANARLLMAGGNDQGGWLQPHPEPPQMSKCKYSGDIFTLEKPVWGCCILKAFPHYLDESCLQGIGAKMILFSMLFSILLRITPSVQACECKWIFQFLKYKLKKYPCDIKNPIRAPSAARLLFAIYH